MMTTVWILAFFSTLVMFRLIHRMFFDGISITGWVIFGVATPTLAVTYGILWVGGWAEYAAQWVG